MFLFEPNRTEFDLNFRLFGVSVRVHPLFWIVSAVLGWGLFAAYGFPYLVLWVALVFLSVLVHEFGHVTVGRIFGSFGHIVLYGFGGLAVGSNHLSNRWQRIAVSFAGPSAQFVILSLVILAWLIWPPTAENPPSALQIALDELWWINLFWPLLNLLPIWPLDGGMISRELFDWIQPEKGVATSLIVSMVIAGLLAISALLPQHNIPILLYLSGDTYLALFFAMFAVNNYFEFAGPANPWTRPVGTRRPRLVTRLGSVTRDFARSSAFSTRSSIL
jgi:stage IV sporulation protein FB